MDIQGPPKTVQRRFLVIMKLSKHKNGHYGSRKIKVTSIRTSHRVHVSELQEFLPLSSQDDVILQILHAWVLDDHQGNM